MLKLADEKTFVSIAVFECKYKILVGLTENSSRFNPLKILMRTDLSTLSNDLEESNFIAYEHRLANRSGVIAFFLFSFCGVHLSSRQISLLMVFFQTWQESFFFL